MPETSSRAARLDAIMPSWQVHEVHSTRVRASAGAVDRAIRAVRADEIALFLALMTVRRLGVPRHDAARPLLETAQEGGFAVLADEPGRELVLGVIGKFWRLRERCVHAIASPEDFVSFADPGWARAAMNFRIEPVGEGACRLTTETRVDTTDAGARRAFRLYWTLVHPGSALIRRMWLRAIRRRAEAAAAQK